MAREKKKVIANVTKEQAEEAMGAFARSSNKLSRIQADMDAKITKIRDQYQEDISKLEDEKTQQMEVLEVYAQETSESWGKRKSLEMVHGIIGYRTGTPKVKFEKGFNTKSVTAILKEQFPAYVRTVDEMDKEKIIADRESEEFPTICKKAHISVVQEETFYVESKSEELQPA